MALLHSRLSREDERSLLFLSDQRLNYRLRYHLLLGRENDLLRSRTYGRNSFLKSDDSRYRAR